MTKTEHVNGKRNMITRINKPKTLVKYILYDCKCKSIAQHVIQTKNGVMIHANVNVKSIVHAINDYSWNLTHEFVRKVRI